MNGIWKDLKGPGWKELLLSGGAVLGAAAAGAMLVAGLDAAFLALARLAW